MDGELREFEKWLRETRDEPLEGMAEFFDARIGMYEEHMRPWSKYYAEIAELLPEGTAELLDLGCGSGLELEEIFRRFPEIRVTGVDLSREMLAACARKFQGFALKTVCADYFSLDFGEERFDAVIAVESLHHVCAEQKSELFGKIFRSLRPGGVFLECDYIASSREIEDLAQSEALRRRRRDGIPEGVPVHFDTPLTLEHECEAICKGGFERVETVAFLPTDGHTPILRAIRPFGGSGRKTAKSDSETKRKNLAQTPEKP